MGTMERMWSKMVGGDKGHVSGSFHGPKIKGVDTSFLIPFFVLHLIIVKEREGFGCTVNQLRF